MVFGTVLFGRLQGGDGVERAMGMFINILPLCITCDNRLVVEALKQTQQDLLKLMRHEHATLSLAQRCSAILAPTPLFSALLNYRHSPLRKNADTILTGIEILQAKERTNYPFDMTVDDLGEGFALTARLDSSLDPDQICDCMQRALEGLVSALEKAPPQAGSLAEILENISLSRVA